MSLIDTLKNEMSGTAIQSLAQRLDIQPEQAQSGITALIPAVLAGILKKGANTDSLGSLSAIFTGNRKPVDAAPESELAEDTPSLLNRGRALVGDLFGGQVSDISKAIEQKTNLSSEKSMGLLTMAAPMVMHGVDKMVSSRGWSIPDFLGKLFEERATIENQLPAGLASGFGLAGLSLPHLNLGSVDAGGRVPPVSPRIPPIEDAVPHASITPEPDSSSGNVLKWIVIVAIIALAAWWFFGRNRASMDNVATPRDSANAIMNTADSLAAMASKTGTTIGGALNEAGDWVYNLGGTKSVALPDGATIEVGENSAEAKLIAFIEDSAQEVNSTTWFSLDRLYFETGKSTLKPESREQLSNIASIMKSFPNVKLKIGGYTDDTGSAETNLKISNDRAQATMKDLVGLGVSADRLEAEGYGSEHPVADNATAEGKAQNRRIDVRVTAK